MAQTPSIPVPNQYGFAAGRETTFFTGPLQADGTVDLVSAVNKSLGNGVTLQNNAFVALLKVTGSGRDLSSRNGAEVTRALGVSEEKGCWISWAGFPGRANKGPSAEEADHLDAAQSGPWEPTAMPQMAAWLKANDKALSMVSEAVERERFWVPVVSAVPSGGAPLTAGHCLLHPQLYHEMGSGLLARAMQAQGVDDTDSAWKDLRAAHHLVHLLGQSDNVLLVVIAARLEKRVIRAEWGLLSHQHLESRLVEAISHDIQSLEPLPTWGEVFTRFDRHLYVDAVQAMARAEAQAPRPGVLALDWDRMLRRGNRFFDELCARHEWESFEASQAWYKRTALAAHDMGDRSGMWPKGHDEKSDVSPLQAETREAYSDRIADGLASMLVPAIGPAAMQIDEARVMLGMAKVAYALEFYRRQKGSYPSDTAEVVTGGYLSSMPRDFYNKAFGYARTADGFKLERVMNFHPIPSVGPA